MNYLEKNDFLLLKILFMVGVFSPFFLYYGYEAFKCSITNSLLLML